MSRYGEDGSTGYAREELYDALYEFLIDHTIADVIDILADVARDREKETIVKTNR